MDARITCFRTLSGTPRRSKQRSTRGAHGAYSTRVLPALHARLQIARLPCAAMVEGRQNARVTCRRCQYAAELDPLALRGLRGERLKQSVRSPRRRANSQGPVATASISASARLLAIRRAVNCWALFALSTADAHRAHRENARPWR